MAGRHTLTRIVHVIVLLAAFMALGGSSCASDLRDNVQAGAYDFFKSGTKDVLSAIFPVKNWFTPAQ
ncbi:MAG TPA: hypothetical protein VMV94_09540 [Phycisphaerae bacterium]|nr:hypothetical protein [Phycisphaerae bacterium]